MEGTKVLALKQAILDLPDGDRQELAREILPLLLTTRAGLEEIDKVLQTLSDEDVEALVDRARSRSAHLSETTIAAVIGEALRTVRAQSRS